MTWSDSYGVSIKTHRETLCAGENCIVHNPSLHHMSMWPTCIRGDRQFLIERICRHGVGHPDPDSLAYFIRIGYDSQGIHGCDGCCYTGGSRLEDRTGESVSIGGFDPDHYFDRPD